MVIKTSRGAPCVVVLAGVLAAAAPSAGQEPLREGAEERIGEIYVPPPSIPGPITSAAPEGIPAAPPITLASLEATALAANPTLRQAVAQVDGTLAKAVQAGLYPNPVIFYRARQIGVEGTPGEFHGGILRQEIVTAGKLRLSRQKYLARTRTAEWIAMAQQFRVLNDVRVHFARALGRQETVAVREQLVRNAEDVVLTTREMFNVGQANMADLHQANALLQRRRLDLQMARNDLVEARGFLSALVGVELPPAPLAGTLEGSDGPPLDYNATLVHLIEHSPEVQQAHAKLGADRITIDRERVQPIPNIFVQGGAGENFEDSPNQVTGMLQVFAEIPLYDRNQGTIRQAQADMMRQQGEIRRVELDLRRRFAQEYRRYLTALQQVENYRSVVLPETRSAYEVLLKSYQEDRAPWPDVLDAEREYFLRRLEYIAQRIDLNESLALLEGFLLHDGLKAPERPTPPGHIDSVPKPR
ncbi:TolC family protein [Tautonia marina]|uniref:TolC family protein n=1 Tax=Tautonia marina TaxID=2653855 RepID=UPI0012610120|nr:TolC family protein [Tautonia marina]